MCVCVWVRVSVRLCVCVCVCCAFFFPFFFFVCVCVAPLFLRGFRCPFEATSRHDQACSSQAGDGVPEEEACLTNNVLTCSEPKLHSPLFTFQLLGGAPWQFRRLISSVFRHCVRASVSVLIPVVGICSDSCKDIFYRQLPDLVARDA